MNYLLKLQTEITHEGCIPMAYLYVIIIERHSNLPKHAHRLKHP